jgi:hypothetical protein
MNRKNGISAVVATVLIILITVAAVTIIWAAVIPMIKENTLGGTTCLDAVSQVSLETDGGYTCKGSDYVNLQISHGAKSFELNDIQVLLSANGTTTTYSIVGDGLLTNMTNASTSDLPGENEAIVFRVENVTSLDEVEIAPIVAVGNTFKTCDVAARAVLTAC